MKQFTSGAQFASFLGLISAEVRQAQTRGLREAGAMIRHEARESLGWYHEGVGPIPEWPQLAEKTVEARERAGYAGNDPLLVTGGLRDHIELSVSEHEAVVGVPNEIVGDGGKMRDIGVVAIAQEEGTAHVPPRPFLSRAAFVMGEKAAKEIGVHVGAAVAGMPIPQRGGAR